MDATVLTSERTFAPYRCTRTVTMMSPVHRSADRRLLIIQLRCSCIPRSQHVSERYSVHVECKRMSPFQRFFYGGSVFRLVMSADFAQLHHRPVGVDGDVGAVVVEDGAGAVDDFLVALDLRHDLLLHLQRRQGDLDARSSSLEIVPLDSRSVAFCLISAHAGCERGMKRSDRGSSRVI